MSVCLLCVTRDLYAISYTNAFLIILSSFWELGDSSSTIEKEPCFEFIIIPIF